MQSLERDQLIKIRKAMELLQARPREHLFFVLDFFSPFMVSWVPKKNSIPEGNHVDVRKARA